MRITLSLDDDVAALIAKIRKTRGASLKEVLNAALTEPKPDNLACINGSAIRSKII